MSQENAKKSPGMGIFMVLLFILPMSLFFFTFNTALSYTDGREVHQKPLSPFRWLFAFLAPIVIVQHGLSKRSLDMSGAVAALVVGFVLTLSNYCFFASLLSFFILGSKATKFKQHLKHKMEEDFKQDGQRNWVQVVCNGGIATEMGLIFMMEAGCGEFVINFSRMYNISWVCMAVLGALACCAGDTFASEFGTVLGSGSPWLITSFRKVPRGTNGGVSIPGTLCSILGGGAVGLAYYVTLLLCIPTGRLHYCPPQWPIVLVGAIAGFLGSIIDSILGATLQYSGYNHVKQCVVERPGPQVEHISGTGILDNHGVNLLSSFFTSLISPSVALYLWREITL